MTDGFGRLAKPYRWMEYLTFGRALERCRFRFLHELKASNVRWCWGTATAVSPRSCWLLLPGAAVHAVDVSPAMLRALQARCGAPDRLTTHCVDLSQELPVDVRALTFDLVTTHFFLDCLSTAQVESLVARVKPLLAEGGYWVVSEFDVPRGGMRLPATLIVRGLYAGFRALTGLRTQRLPDYRTAMEQHGFVCRTRIPSLGGLLVAELWTAGN